MSEDQPGAGRDALRESRGVALWHRVTAPARSEQAAFRVVLFAAGIAVALALIVAAVRAVG